MKGGIELKNSFINMTELKNGIYACLVKDEGIGFSNSGFINHGQGLVIDTMYDLRRASELKRLCGLISGNEAGVVINTHSNGDHIWGNQVFEGAKIIGHSTILEDAARENPEDFQNLKKLSKVSDDIGVLEFAKLIEPFDFEGIKIVLPDTTFDEGMKLKQGQVDIEIVYNGPAHTRGDSMVWIESEKILFTGDILFNGCTPILWIGMAVENWIRILDKIANEMKPDYIVPGHGPLANVEDVLSFKSYLENVMKGTKSIYESGIKDPMEIAKMIDISEYMDWTEPERLYINVISVIKGIEKDFSPMNFLEIAKGVAKLRDYFAQNR